MTVANLIADLESLGVRLWEESGQLHFRAPQGVLTDQRRQALRDNKEAVVEYLRGDGDRITLEPQPELRHEPFPLGDLQSAYLLGRRDAFAYGGVGSHIYAEISFTGLEPETVEAAWQELVRRHDMLRAVIDPSGLQQVLAVVPPPAVPADDLRGLDAESVEAAVAKVRAELEHRTYAPDQWPLFDLRMTHGDQRLLLHLSIDFLIADFSSIQRLLLDLNQLCYTPQQALPPLEISYRDYLVAVRRARGSARHERDQAYWSQRLDTLSPAPDLPLADRAEQAPPTFTRHAVSLSADTSAALRERAASHAITVSTTALAAFAEVIGRWSQTPRFTLNLTLFDRQPFHPQVPLLVGDFTAISPHEVDTSPTGPFAERARTVQSRLWDDMDHRAFTGVEVLRELTRRRGAAASLLPVVFTSTIGMNEVGTGERQRAGQGQFVYGVTQTPQVWIDCQVSELGDGLTLNWDVRDGVLRGGVVEDMVTAYTELLSDLARDDEAWNSPSPVRLPACQREQRRLANDTAAAIPDQLLHEGVLAQARRTPDRLAVLTADRGLTFGELLGRATAVAAWLRAEGCTRGTLVGVVMDKGWEQVVGALGVLLAGGAYVPVDTHQPTVRRDQVLTAAGIRLVLTQSWLDGLDGFTTAAVDRLEPVDASPPQPRLSGPDDLAYVIHTSGSTGVPKGVMITHRGAVNTVTDINRRCAVTDTDRILGLAHLGFDLSVYDLFGPLAAGGALVLPRADRHADPSHWAALIEAHQVTLLNTVPAQMHMLTAYLATVAPRTLTSLRTAFMSGDRIPAALPDQIRDRIPQVELLGLGGPTETTIWSIHFPIGEVNPDWSNVPYGRPLTNHGYHVLDEWLRDRPDWVSGEICTTGAGLAVGYLGDPERTGERFVTHPATGERLYRSGDIGRYLPDATIEILGREDAEVKVRGHRIALAEVESGLLSHPEVAGAAVVVDDTDAMDPRLVAFIVPATVPSTAGAGMAGSASAERTGEVGRDWSDAATQGLGGPDSAERLVALGAQLDRTGLLVMLDGLVRCGAFVEDRPYSLAEILATGQVAPRYVRLVRRWLRSLAAAGMLRPDPDAGTYQLAGPYRAEEVGEAWQEVRRLSADLPSERPLLDYFTECARILTELLRGSVDPIQLLYPQGNVDTAVAVFQHNLVSHASNVLLATALAELVEERAAHRGGDPVRVLELGAGHWGATAQLLPGVAGADYLFTDVSEFFVNTARSTYAGHPSMRHAVFDMNRDYRAQGLAANSVDVIVAANVMHYARDSDAVLARLRELLAPGGWIVFTDTIRDNYLVLTSVEFLFQFDDESPDFDDARHGRDESFLSTSEWSDVLTGAGGVQLRTSPGPEHALSRLGARMFAARFKPDRASPSVRDLRRHAATRLPDYMLPSAILLVDELPVTEHAKVDRARLRTWLPQRGSDGAAPALTANVEGPRDDLEARLAQIWADVLAVARVGREQDFFELGGDSLLAARLVGDVGERMPEASEVFFEDLLAAMLREPTVAALAGYLRANSTTAASGEGLHESCLLDLGGGTDGPALVLVHDATGNIPEPSNTAGPLLALVVDDVSASVSGGADTLIERLATRYADLLLERGMIRLRLRGRGFGGPLALEMARALMEAGVLVETVGVDAEYRPPYEIGDDAFADYCFAVDSGCDLAALGMPTDRAAVARAAAEAAQHGPVTAAALAAAVHSGGGVAASFAALLARPEAQRREELFAAYLTARPRTTPEQARLAHEFHRHALAAASGYEPDPYAGDLILHGGGEPVAWQPDGTAGFWDEICLGELVTEPAP